MGLRRRTESSVATEGAATATEDELVEEMVHHLRWIAKDVATIRSIILFYFIVSMIWAVLFFIAVAEES